MNKDRNEEKEENSHVSINNQSYLHKNPSYNNSNNLNYGYVNFEANNNSNNFDNLNKNSSSTFIYPKTDIEKYNNSSNTNVINKHFKHSEINPEITNYSIINRASIVSKSDSEARRMTAEFIK